jgi:hypothetical protein
MRRISGDREPPAPRLARLVVSMSVRGVWLRSHYRGHRHPVKRRVAGHVSARVPQSERLGPILGTGCSCNGRAPATTSRFCVRAPRLAVNGPNRSASPVPRWPAGCSDSPFDLDPPAAIPTIRGLMVGIADGGDAGRRVGSRCDPGPILRTAFSRKESRGVPSG